MKVRDVLLVLAGAVAALSIAGILWLAVDNDTATAPTSTAYQRQLTGAEAEAIAESEFLNAACDTLDFNESSFAWIVRCTHFGAGVPGSLGVVTYRVYDISGEVEPVP